LADTRRPARGEHTGERSAIGASSSHADRNRAPRRGGPAPHALLTISGIALALMQTLVIPALPFFRREFDASAGAVTWPSRASW
jgi:hypothetical protein